MSQFKEESMSYTRINRCAVTAFVTLVSLTALFLFGCNDARNTNTANMNTNANANPSATANMNANSNSAMPVVATVEPREPDRYSVTTTITVQPQGSTPQANIPPLQFSFARMGTDRRVSFKLPDPVGEVIYLEKPTLKYLIFPARNQYVELDPQELGFKLGDVMSPASMVARLKERSQWETVATETVNGRTAIKYRFRGATDTHTKVGTAQVDSIVYVDQETGLPLRSEIDTTSTSGAGARVVTNADSLQLTPDASLFDVPTTMKKVSSAELKQQVQGFAAVVRSIAAFVRQQAPATPPAAQP
jgi:hypothetical protein